MFHEIRSSNTFVDYYFQYAKEITWGSLPQLAQNTILSLMSRIDVGYVRVLCKGRIYEFGPKDSKLRGELKVVNDSFWIRVLLHADLGFAESYMAGEVICDDLITILKIFIANRSQLDLKSVSSYIANAMNYVMNCRFANTITNAINNISTHYDISNEFFASFLSNDMTYSCAIFANEKESLEEAQKRKLRMIIDKAKITKDDHVLEIGTGWGSFAIEAVRLTGCRVTSLTLSVEQKILAEERITKAGFSDNITVLLCDYRNLPASHQFDKIVSIEMLEHVGQEYLSTYFKCCDKLLKEKDGIAVFQTTTMTDARYDQYCKNVDFIRKYIFPGGHLPSVSSTVEAINKGSNGKLMVSHIEDIGPHYVRTLRLWRERFLAAFDSQILPALLKDCPNMTLREVGIFKRKWEFYFAYCEGGFISRLIGNVQIVLTREGNEVFLDGIPL